MFCASVVLRLISANALASPAFNVLIEVFKLLAFCNLACAPNPEFALPVDAKYS